MAALAVGLGVGSAPPAFASPFGVNAHIPAAVVVDEIAAAGIQWVRIDFEWSRVEAEPDTYDWRVYDRLLERLEGHDVAIFATIGSTPEWATSSAAFSGVPSDPDDWQEFVYLAAARYRGRIHAWGLWNEPNLPRFWQGSRREYLDLILLPGSRAIRAADPQALVCGPDLAHLSSAHWDDWLRQVIEEAGHFLDVVTHHVYPGNGRASDVLYELDQRPSWLQNSPSVRDVLQDTGWWGRPFWLTETGVESQRVGWSGQAAFVRDLVDQWFGPIPEARWLDRVFLYQIHDPPAPDTSTFGLLTSWPDLERKFAFDAYAESIAATVFDDGQVLAVNSPRFVRPGEMVEIVITLRNIGTTTWRGEAGYGLEVISDRIAWRIQLDRLPPQFTIEPGDTATTSIFVQAPWIVVPNNRQATVRARMVAADGRRFGTPITVVITASGEEPPQIVTQPTSVIAVSGATVSFRASATSASQSSYQWLRNSVELDDGAGVFGSRSPKLELTAIDRSAAGDYHCVVTNDAGSVVSEPAKLTIGVPRPRISSGRLPSKAASAPRSGL